MERIKEGSYLLLENTHIVYPNADTPLLLVEQGNILKVEREESEVAELF